MSGNNFLWQKESNGEQLYIDLFPGIRQRGGIQEWERKIRTKNWQHGFLPSMGPIKPGKNNDVSLYFKNQGNSEFQCGRWVEAMEFYNQSLSFAEVGTDNVSYAYANRASCFLKMKEYDKCLKDIELAIDAKYPANLMPKLLQRKADCEKLMKNHIQPDSFDPKLSFDPSKKFPCMADVLEIQQNDEFGRHVVAKADIGVGQTILVEEAFVSIASGWDRVNCYDCLQTTRNFIPCSNCTDVMFCDDTCQKRNEVHNKFCDVSVNRMSTTIRYIAKSIMIALIAFENANGLITFVEDFLPKRSTQLPSAGNDNKSKYALFLSLQRKDINILAMNIEMVYKMFSGLLDVPAIKDEFNTKSKQRFLMHLIGEHFLIIANNSFGGLSSSSSTGTTALVLSLFNHACAPNVFNSSAVNKEVCITMRPIKKGEQLFIKYLCGDRTTRERQELLLEQWNFVCECDKCEPKYESTDRIRMKNDPSYKAIAASKSDPYLEFQKNPVLMTKCVKFLEQYGHLPWSAEMDVVLKYYTKCLLDPFPSM